MEGSQQLVAEEPGQTAQQIPDRARAYRIVHGVTPLRRRRVGLLRFVLRVGPKYLPIIERPLIKMKVIHLARWSIVEEVPSRDRPGTWQRLPQPYLVFESDFDGPWRPYIEDFARIMPWQWRAIWGAATEFPGPLPVSGLLAYVEEHDKRAEHHYSAHTHETLEGTLAAVELERRLKDFATATQDLPDDALADRWLEFLDDVQGLL